MMNAGGHFVDDTPQRQVMIEGLRAVKASLGHGGAAENVATVLHETLG